jgi:hypothetical protein
MRIRLVTTSERTDCGDVLITGCASSLRTAYEQFCVHHPVRTAQVTTGDLLNVKSCGLTNRHAQSSQMEQRAVIGRRLPLRPQDETECRRCAVFCDKVVHPSRCVEQACPFVYAYEEWGRTYIGCMQKVYDVEIDLALLNETRNLKGGFGAVRAKRRPLPMCGAEVSKCYERRSNKLDCINPEFHELPKGKPAFRVIARSPNDSKIDESQNS